MTDREDVIGQAPFSSQTHGGPQSEDAEVEALELIVKGLRVDLEIKDHKAHMVELRAEPSALNSRITAATEKAELLKRRSRELYERSQKLAQDKSSD